MSKKPKKERRVKYSFRLGLLGLLLCIPGVVVLCFRFSYPLLIACSLPGLASLLAIVFGHSAVGRIKDSDGRLEGGLGARLGQLTGCLGLIIFLIGGTVAYRLKVGPELQASRQRHQQQVECRQNLEKFKRAFIDYYSAHGGAYPPDLATLAEGPNIYLPASKVYRCAPGQVKAPSTPADIRNGMCDYLYFGKGVTRDNVTNASATVIMCDKPGNHKHGDKHTLNVLFVNGDIREGPAANIREAAAEQGWIIPNMPDDASKTPAAPE